MHPLFITSTSEANFRELVHHLQAGPVAAIIGAGLSATMQPTWKALHEELQNISGIETRRSFDPAFAPADFSDFRDAMTSDQFVGALRHRFGGLVAAYPDLYRILDETRGVEPLVTTNYDEFLASVAASNSRTPRISIFPNFNDLGARYIYLHGRAQSATSPSDLVLCEEDYGYAYGAPGVARDMLRVLMGRPCLFVGSSLQDPDLLALVRERQRLSRNTDPILNQTLFAVLPTKFEDGHEEGLVAAAEVMLQRLHRLGVKAICYPWDAGHTKLRACLLQLQHEAERRRVEAVFLDRARQLNRLGQTNAPNPQQVTQVVNIVRSIPELALHFFKNSATSLDWYDALKDSVIIPSAVEPRELADGSIQISAWAPAAYISRIATHRPDVVIELVTSLAATQNWQVQNVLAGLAVKLPPDDLAPLMPVLYEWLNSPYSSSNHVSETLASLPGQFVQQQRWSMASDLVSELLLPTQDSMPSRYKMRIDDYLLTNLRPVIGQLVAMNPKSTFLLLKHRLESAIASTGESPINSGYWRQAIEDHEQNFTDMYPSLHFLLEAARDALVYWLSTSGVEATEELTSLLQSDSNIFRRLALYTLGNCPAQIPMIGALPITEADFYGQSVFHELSELLSLRFGELDDSSQAQVHHWLAIGPSKLEKESESDWKRYRDTWIWQWLSVIDQEYWNQEEHEHWEALKGTHQPLEHPTFTLWHGKWERSIDHDDSDDHHTRQRALEDAWESGGAQVLVETLRSSSNWGHIVGMIRKCPKAFDSVVPLLNLEDGEALATLFSAFESIVGLDNELPDLMFDWLPLIELMERIVDQGPADLPWTSSQMARLVERGVGSKSNPIPIDLVERVATVMGRLLQANARPLDTDPEQGGRIESGHQINSAAGNAANAFMRCVWQQLFLSTEEQRQLPEEARLKIDAALESGWGGLEMRHALGEFWFVPGWGQPGWLETSFDRLWPSQSDWKATNIRRAFLFGFLQASSWSRPSLLALRPLFSEVIQDLVSESPVFLDRQTQSEGLVYHLVLGWLYEVESFDFDDLIGEFVKLAPDEVRATFVRQLGQQIRIVETGDEPDMEVTDARRAEYWTRRADELSKNLPISESSKELAAFLTWLESSRRSLKDSVKLLNVSIDHLPEWGGAHELLKFIAGRAEAEPLYALRLLLRMANRLFIDQRLYIWGHSREIDAAIEALCRGIRPSHYGEARQLADRMMRAGLPELSSKLQQRMAKA